MTIDIVTPDAGIKEKTRAGETSLPEFQTISIHFHPTGVVTDACDRRTGAYDTASLGIWSPR